MRRIDWIKNHSEPQDFFLGQAWFMSSGGRTKNGRTLIVERIMSDSCELHEHKDPAIKYTIKKAELLTAYKHLPEGAEPEIERRPRRGRYNPTDEDVEFLNSLDWRN